MRCTLGYPLSNSGDYYWESGQPGLHTSNLYPFVKLHIGTEIPLFFLVGVHQIDMVGDLSQFPNVRLCKRMCLEVKIKLLDTSNGAVMGISRES